MYTKSVLRFSAVFVAVSALTSLLEPRHAVSDQQLIQRWFVSIAAEDGWVKEESEDADVGSQTNSSGTGGRAIRLGDDAQDRQIKGILSFDTSAIPEEAQVESVELRLTRGGVNGENPIGSFGVGSIDIATGHFGDSAALEASDFQGEASAYGVGFFDNPGE
jgi:hypothetical protein